MDPAKRVYGVTGATGLLGWAWLRQLLAREPQVRVVALTRDPSQATASLRWRGLSPSERNRVQWVAVDLRSSTSLRAARPRLQQVDAAWWHFAAATHLSREPGSEELAREINAEGTRRLLETLQSCQFPGSFYHISSAFAAGSRSVVVTEDFDDDAAGDFRNPYEQSKAEAESHVRAFFANGGRGAVFRPSVVIGQGSRGGNQFLDLCQRGLEVAQRFGEREIMLRIPSSAQLNLVPLDWTLNCCFALAGLNTEPAVYHLTADADTSLQSLFAAAATRVPSVSLRFAPEATRDSLSPGSKLIDRMLEPLRDYCLKEQKFCRTRSAPLLPPALRFAPAVTIASLLLPSIPAEAALVR
jgi:nucleoside-diphosphate-sugar epimerase